MVGSIFGKEAGCKCRECCVGEESCPSGDEGGGSGMAQRCWSVTCFRSAEVGDEKGGFLTPTASHCTSQDHQTAPGIVKAFRIGPFFGFAGIMECCGGKAACATARFTGAGEW